MDSASHNSSPESLFGEQRITVLLPVLLDKTYDYVLAPGMAAPKGTFVLVPFGAQQRIGVVWDARGDDEPSVDPAKLKTVLSVLDVPALNADMRRFIEWVSRYTLTPRGMVLRLAMSAQRVFEPQKPRFGVRRTGPVPDRLTPARRRVIEIAQDGLIRAKADLAREAGVSSAVVSGLVTAGTLTQVQIPQLRMPAPNPDHIKAQFEGEQVAAVEAMRATVAAGAYSVTLLDGITGSGKTEVYFEAIAEAVRKGQQVLVMLPEIALTSQFGQRFEHRFGCPTIEWHSSISTNERARVWRAVANGDAQVVIGARSALFLPFADLGLIIVDEEHDTAFKQVERVTYQGRDMAVVRGSICDAPVILASATPSIESHVNARNGRYRHVRLTERYSDAELPEITAIDLKKHPPERGRWLSPVLQQAVRDTHGRGQQSLLFLNRRGYAPLTLCRSCGHRFDCPQCTAWLVEHRFRGRLKCHHCGFSTPQPKHCPKCGDVDSLVPCGPGVERIAEEVRQCFPELRLAILSSDLTPNLADMRHLLATIERGDVDLIIGTQIVAKGHHFPNLSLVGVVDGDLGLGQADPRAAERTFQLLCQVTGRAGRTGTGGRGLVQTHLPDHPVMEAIISGDRETFISREISQRQAATMPPFGRLVAIVISCKQKALAEEFARLVARRAPPARTIAVLGPTEAPLAVIRGRHRFRLLVKCPREVDIQNYLGAWLDLLPPIKGDLRLSVDIDPYSFL